MERATRVAREFAQQYMRDDVVGIVFLGGVARGYFDRFADIDIAVFAKQGPRLPVPAKFSKIEGLEVQIWWSEYETEQAIIWDMAKRWTYSQGQIHYDPEGKVAELLKEKVPLRPEEKKWLMMSGLALSEWYVNRLTRLWVERGNLISAHHMFEQGLNYFLEMLFGLNDELVADMKWRYYSVEQLERLPHDFRERIKDVLILHSISVEELDRRQKAFMEMWQEMKPIVEAQVHMSFEEMLEIV